MPEFTAPRAFVRDALAKVSKVAVKGKAALPVLRLALFESRTDGVYVTATDMDMAITARIEGASRFKGDFLADPREIGALARKATGNDITIGFDPPPPEKAPPPLDDGAMEDGSEKRATKKPPKIEHVGTAWAKCDPVKVKFSEDQPRSHWPTTLKREVVATIDMEAVHLIAMLKDCQPCISMEETRYYLNGVYLHGSQAGGIVCVATDGHRLAKSAKPIVSSADDMNAAIGQGEFAGKGGIIIPHAAVRLLLALVKPSGMIRMEIMDSLSVTAATPEKTIPGKTPDESITVPATPETVSRSHRTWAHFTLDGGTVLMTKLIDGTFPDYTRVIPNVAEITPLVVHVGRLSRALDILPQGGRGSPAVKLTSLEDTMVMEHRTYDTQNDYRAVAKDAIDSGKLPSEIGFNRNYLAGVLRFISGDGMGEIFCKSVGDPLIFRRKGEADRFMVLMPMRV